MNSKTSATSSANKRHNPSATGLPAPDFDLSATLSSGQVFHWTEHDGVWWGVLDGRALWIRQHGESIVCPADSTAEVGRFLALDHPMEKINRRLGQRDPVLRRAMEFAPGLRILRQPIWECLATFITSSMKQVAHIRAISLTLRQRFGREVGRNPVGGPLFSYPEPLALASAGESVLRECALGYRAKGLAATAAMVADGRADLGAWADLPTPALRERLLGLPGVGPKIADCVLLFAYGRLEAFPVDVWIARAVKNGYFKGEEIPEREIIAFAVRRFGEYAGYAQQFLFHHARMTGPRQPRSPAKK